MSSSSSAGDAGRGGEEKEKAREEEEEEEEEEAGAATKGESDTRGCGADVDDDASGGWILLGCDSDAGGALAVVRGPRTGIVASVDVIDVPTVKVEVNGRPRVRLAVDGVVALVAAQRFPAGTTVHLEEGGVEYGFSAQTAFVQGYNFGLWKGVLAAAGLTVNVVKPQAWKWALGLARKDSTKDESRALAAAVFPEVAEDGLLRRKKDHGRAEALLIAAYGHVAAQHSRRGDDVADDGDAPPDDADPLCARIRGAVGDAEAGRGGRSGEATLTYFGPYFGMTGKALAKECRARGLKVTGKKMELVARLEEDDAERRRRRRRVEEGKGTAEEGGEAGASVEAENAERAQA